MTRKWYATLRHPKMYPHTKFGIPTSKNIGDMDRTRKRDGLTDGRTDGLTDGRTDSAITICLPKFLWGHKNMPSVWCTLIEKSIFNISPFNDGNQNIGTLASSEKLDEMPRNLCLYHTYKKYIFHLLTL